VREADCVIPWSTPRRLVITLCEEFGFGWVMQCAADEWARLDPLGALTVGPCVELLEPGSAQFADAVGRRRKKAVRPRAHPKKR
jgi:hypothetical protein